MTKYLKKTLTLSIYALSIVTSPAIANDLHCPALMNNGIYEGVFTRLIHTDDYHRINYVFRDSTTRREACVQVEEAKTVKMNAIYGAFILGQTVTIRVVNDHFLDSIAIPSS
ncbi:hypothetical protein [Klebsiella sp. BIGb0407]|uniref:hypothetical protein n=1 Tax=Klebsiella sp. BIGb0407 TaxID=2940603 RepID=UPI002166D8B2|nr:hypothetical protein [Klebsiella sp. BIGb0407]MCS3431429.1 hypothetical protein [Klebsiella sp. BIGb0407]